MKLCRRKTDGAVFKASCPPDYCGGQAIADVLRGRLAFYFLGVKWQPRKWWQLRGKWVETGEAWEPTSDEFDVFDA